MSLTDRPTLIEGAVPENRWRILTTLLFGLFSVNVTVTILAVSIPSIARDLDAPQSTVTWVVTGPMLAFGVIGPLVGKLGDRLGHRRLFLWGLTGAAVMSALSALAWSAGALIAFRTLGAIEGAATGPASFAVISRIFPREERVRALGYWSMVGAGAPVIGVIVGGPLVQAFGWRLLFLGQVPVILLALALAFRLMPETPRYNSGAFDLAGAVLVALTVTPVLFAVTEAPRIGWTSPVVIGCLLVSPFALVGFVRVERRAESPLLPLHYLRRPGFTYAITAQALLNAAYMGSFILTPLLMQNVLDPAYSPTKTGLVSLARPLSFSLAGVFAGAIALRLGGRRTATVGASGLVLALLWMSSIGPHATAFYIAGALALAGVGMGVAMPPLVGSVTVSVEDKDLGVAGSAQQMMSQVGIVFGIQIMQSVQRTRLPAVGLASSYHWGYLAGLGIAAMGVLAATRIVSVAGPASPGEDEALEPLHSL